jgi:hypothetical protein
LLRLDDARYPRPRPLAALRSVGRVGWLPVSVYAGNAASGLVSTAAAHGVAATASRDALVQTLHLDGLLALAAQSPLAALLLAAVVVALGALIFFAQRDTRREAAIVRGRELMRLMQERAARAMTAESLRDDLRQLQAALADGTAAVAAEADPRPSDLGQRLARLTQISEMLNQDLAARAMWDALMEQQMSVWQRRQRVWSAGMGLASVVIGGLLPVVLSTGVVGG